jgi:hypothetical protein
MSMTCRIFALLLNILAACSARGAVVTLDQGQVTLGSDALGFAPVVVLRPGQSGSMKLGGIVCVPADTGKVSDDTVSLGEHSTLFLSRASVEVQFSKTARKLRLRTGSMRVAIAQESRPFVIETGLLIIRTFAGDVRITHTAAVTAVQSTNGMIAVTVRDPNRRSADVVVPLEPDQTLSVARDGRFEVPTVPKRDERITDQPPPGSNDVDGQSTRRNRQSGD